MQELLTANQVQRLFDVDRSTIYRMASDGRLPAVKIGRQWRFPADGIRRLMALPSDHKTETTIIVEPEVVPSDCWNWRRRPWA